MRAFKLFLSCAIALLLASCHYHHADIDEDWDMTVAQHDSILFAQTHHYTLNYNFSVLADSMVLHFNPPSALIEKDILNDSMTVYKDDKLVVADIVRVPPDSTPPIFWIKVARDQETIGWVSEKELLGNVIPCDPISQFIHAFSNRHLFAFYLILGLAAFVYIYRIVHRKRIYIVHFNDINSLYPTLFCLFTALTAVLYGSIQKFVPDTWQEFYYYPTLNPFGQPFILFAFLSSVWLLFLFGIASMDETRRQLQRSEAVAYLFGLACTSLVLYIFFSLTIQIYIGYPCFAVYCVFAVRRYLSHNVSPYICGKCGKPLKHLGRCPYCGTFNK